MANGIQWKVCTSIELISQLLAAKLLLKRLNLTNSVFGLELFEKKNSHNANLHFLMHLGRETIYWLG
jgi:hypothetical protein